MTEVPPPLRTGHPGVPRVIPTADVMRALPYISPLPNWHGHGPVLIPTATCAACNELRRREAEAAGDGGE